jgi:hypothetical protein
MARAALEVNRTKLGLSASEALSAGDRERLLEFQKHGQRVFLGQYRTAQILDEIRAAIAPGGPASGPTSGSSGRVP